MPEIAWWWSQSGPTTGYQHWGDDKPLPLRAGSAVWVRVAATSGNEVPADYANANFVVPADIEVAKYNQQSGDYEHPLTGAENGEVGAAPNHEVKFFSAERRWMPSFTWMGIYLLVVPSGVQRELSLLYGVTVGEETESLRRISVSE